MSLATLDATMIISLLERLIRRAPSYERREILRRVGEAVCYLLEEENRTAQMERYSISVDDNGRAHMIPQEGAR